MTDLTPLIVDVFIELCEQEGLQPHSREYNTFSLGNMLGNYDVILNNGEILLVDHRMFYSTFEDQCTVLRIPLADPRCIERFLDYVRTRKRPINS